MDQKEKGKHKTEWLLQLEQVQVELDELVEILSVKNEAIKNLIGERNLLLSRLQTKLRLIDLIEVLVNQECPP